ncbi:hypothetical protein [Shewanella sp. KCT]|uniref:hypothetical protein n=1 Tax=Shewanella sp. KCT TaxID=2569535 RepID=UPI0011823BF4|nr:hypothetical protein [Shewanella sp. KCT]TVP11763.1 hypothetical protein AYI87_15140 [Shewanella sp. KCT]
MKIKFDRKYLAVLAEFVGKNDIRYFINGFHIKPHKEVGVILTATDGHRLVTIHDENGFTDGEYIFPISKGLLAASKKGKIEDVRALVNVMILNGQAMVTSIECEKGEWPDQISEDYSHQVGYVEFIKPIAGRYVNAARVFENLGKPVGTEIIGLNTAYLASLDKLKVSGVHPGGKVFLFGPDKAIAIVTGIFNEIVAVIMPMNIDSSDSLGEIPAFTLESGQQRPETHDESEGQEAA